jgi:hypothetical protein
MDPDRVETHGLGLDPHMDQVVNRLGLGCNIGDVVHRNANNEIIPERYFPTSEPIIVR